LYEKIVKLAEKDNRSVENMVETVLKRWVEKESPKVGRFFPDPIQPVISPYSDIRTDGPIVYRTPPGAVPNERILTDTPIAVCEGTTGGPNGAMFASTDNPNGTCVTNGEGAEDSFLEITGPWDDEDNVFS